MSDFVHAQVSVRFCTLRLSTITQLSHSHHLTTSSIQRLHNFLIIQPTSVVMKGPRPQRETYSHAHTVNSLKRRPWLKKRSELPATVTEHTNHSLHTVCSPLINCSFTVLLALFMKLPSLSKPGNELQYSALSHV